MWRKRQLVLRKIDTMESRTLLRICIVIAIVGVVTPKAVFEIDLIEYHAQPHKCCDGYKWVPIGPAKCNECDPYFKICMNHIPGGPSQCVTTSRENNVHSADLTHGNIQPNHLSMNLENLQGSLSVDVDIKDYDSTTKDDDIDHLYYTFKSVPSTEKVTVVLNGTKVRLTIALLVKCQPNYYGRSCSIFCESGPNSFCTSLGERICKSGFSGTDCDSKADASVSLSSLTTPSTMAPSSSLQTVTLSSSSSSTSGMTSTITDSVSSSSARLTAITDASSTSSSRLAAITDASSTSSSRLTTITNSSSTSSSRLTSTTDSSSTSSPSQTTSSLKPTPSSVDLQETSEANPSTEIVRPGISSTQSNPVTVKERESETSSPRTSKSASTELSTQDRADISTEYHVIGTTSAIKRNRYDIPEPLEIYSCNVMIEGHKLGLHQSVEEIITLVLFQETNVTEQQQVRVRVTSSTFETTDNGIDVTDVSFIVHHNGNVLTAVEVSRRLFSPKTSDALASHLQAKNLKQYRSSPTTVSTQKDDVKSWISNHLPFVIVISCLLGVCLMVFLVVLSKTINRRALVRNKKQDFPKSLKFNDDHTLQLYNNKNSFDTPFALENPLYDFNSDQMQPPSSSQI